MRVSDFFLATGGQLWLCSPCRCALDDSGCGWQPEGDVLDMYYSRRKEMRQANGMTALLHYLLCISGSV